MAFTPNDDLNILQAADQTNVGAGLGDDVYVLDGSVLNDDQTIRIFDTEGDNTLRLVGGLEITQTQATSTALLLTLSNGATVTLLGANTFTFETGGNPLNGDDSESRDYEDFLTQSLDYEELPGTTPETGPAVDVNQDGSTTITNNPIFSINRNAAAVEEGESASWSVDLADAETGESYSVTLAEVLQGGATAADVGTLTVSGTGVTYNAATGVITFAAGANSATVTLPFLADTESPEAGEVVELTLSNPTNGAVVSATADSAAIEITDVPSTPGETFTLTDSNAILTNDLSQSVTPADTYLADADDTIDAFNNLNGSIIDDPSSTDNDVLNALINKNDVSATLTNIEILNFRAIAAEESANFDFAGVVGTDLVTIAANSSRDLQLFNFADDGRVEVRLAGNKTLTIDTTTGAATDVYNLSVEGTTGNAQIDLNNAGGNAVDIAEVNLESRGAAENSLTLDPATGNYTGINALNITGTAALNVTTPFGTAMDIDAISLTGDLTLNLAGAALDDLDLTDRIDGDVKVLGLSGYANADEGDSILAQGIGGLEEVQIGTGDSDSDDDDIDLTIAADVDVSMIKRHHSDANTTIVVDGADTDDDAALTLNVGGDAAIKAGSFTAANIQNLTVNSTGHAHGNSINGFTTDALESLTVNASTDFENANAEIDMADGTEATFDTFSLSLSGDADIHLGTLTHLDNINQIAVANTGAGNRFFIIDSETDLDQEVNGNEGGVDITGTGTGDMVVSAPDTVLDQLRIDGSGYTGNVTVFAEIEEGFMQKIDAENFTGIDMLNLNIRTSVNTGNDIKISNLDADVPLKISLSQIGMPIGNEFTVTGSTTTRDVLLFSQPEHFGNVDRLILNDAETLNITTENTHQDSSHYFIGHIEANAANTVNMKATEDTDLRWHSQYETFAGTAGNRVFTLSLTGAGAIDAGGITSGADLDFINIVANGKGDRDIWSIDTKNMADGGALTFTGDGDVDIGRWQAGSFNNGIVLGEDAVGTTINLNSDADITVAYLTGNVDDTKKVVINSESSDGSGENELTDASNLGFGDAVGGPDASTLEITGNQDLTLGTIATANTYLALGADDGDTDTLDASAFTGTLIAGLTREAAGTKQTQTVNIGTGDAEITLNADGAAAGDDVFKFVFSEDGIADVVITNFSMDDQAAGVGNDVLDFSALTGAGAAVSSYTDATGVLLYNDGTQVAFAVDTTGANDVLVGTSAAFDGDVTIALTETDLVLGDLNAANFF